MFRLPSEASLLLTPFDQQSISLTGGAADSSYWINESECAPLESRLQNNNNDNKVLEVSRILSVGLVIVTCLTLTWLSPHDLKHNLYEWVKHFGS